MEDLLEKKEAALEYFKQELFRWPEAKAIGQIVLFGSLARKTPGQNSDADLAIFTFRDRNKISELSAEVASQVGLEKRESIEPLVFCVDKLRNINSYFIFNILKRGRVIYKMNEREFSKNEAIGYLELARTYLTSAKRNFKENDFRVTIDLGYNAAELCVKGLLILKMADIPGSHGGIVNRLGELYIKTGELDMELNKELRKGLEYRNLSRYEPHADIRKEDGERVIKLAELLIKNLEGKII